MRGFIITVLFGLAVDVTSGQRRIQLIPQYPVLNGDVTLSVTGNTEEIHNFSWYQGPNTNAEYLILTNISGSPVPPVPGPQLKTRMMPFSNGSLQIKDLRISDVDDYTVIIQTVSRQLDMSVTLKAYEPVTKPKVIALPTQPRENDTFILTCDTSKAITITWTRHETHISSEAKLSGDNKTLTFFSAKRGDSGEYWCEAQNLASKKSSDPYTVSVAYGPDEAQIQGALLVSLGSSITLTCSADSEPYPEYQWRFNEKVLEQKIYKYSISNATTENKGLYTCVLRNPVTQRFAIASVYVNVTAETTTGHYSTIGLALVLAFAIILGVVLIIVASFFLHRKFSTRRLKESAESRQNIPGYEDVQAPQVAEESTYTDLEFRSDDIYTDLRR